MTIWQPVRNDVNMPEDTYEKPVACKEWLEFTGALLKIIPRLLVRNDGIFVGYEPTAYKEGHN
jgi:hypothetical protein